MHKDIEIWEDIKGYEGLYQISNLGQVKSLEKYVPYKHTSNALQKKPCRILKGEISKCGYIRVVLQNCKRERCLVHRLVANAFISNPENKKTVNHKDGNKQNNSARNLEWATQSENLIHAVKTGLKPSYPLRHPFARPLINISTGEIKSTSEVSKETGISISDIKRMTRGHIENKTKYILHEQ